jgi:hypothetical protein
VHRRSSDEARTATANTPQSELDDHSTLAILNSEKRSHSRHRAQLRSETPPAGSQNQSPKLHTSILHAYFNFFSVNFSRTAVLVDGYAISSLNATITYPTKTILAVMMAQMADIVVEPTMSAQHQQPNHSLLIPSLLAETRNKEIECSPFVKYLRVAK